MGEPVEAGTGPLLWVLAEEESEGPQSVAKALVHTRGKINIYIYQVVLRYLHSIAGTRNKRQFGSTIIYKYVGSKLYQVQYVDVWYVSLLLGSSRFCLGLRDGTHRASAGVLNEAIERSIVFVAWCYFFENVVNRMKRSVTCLFMLSLFFPLFCFSM